MDRKKSLACCSPWGHAESDMTEHTRLKLCAVFAAGYTCFLLDLRDADLGMLGSGAQDMGEDG